MYFSSRVPRPTSLVAGFSAVSCRLRPWLTALATPVLLLILFLLSGCTTTPRLRDNFDTDAVGGPPATYPPPNPPADVLSYTVTQQVVPTVVAAPGGGRWLRFTPTPAFIASPDARKRAAIFTTDTFTIQPSAQIRGSVRLRVDGMGGVTLGLRPIQGNLSADFIAALLLENYLLPGPFSGEANILPDFSLARIENDIFSLPSRGKLAGYRPGTAITINWSIDQASRTFAASADGGPSHSTVFPAVSGGVATTPIQKLALYVWVQKPSSNTAIFIDDVLIEEYR